MGVGVVVGVGVGVGVGEALQAPLTISCGHYSHTNPRSHPSPDGLAAMPTLTLTLPQPFTRWLSGDTGVAMDPLDADEPDVTEYHHLPDCEALAEQVKCCLEESDEVTKDFTTLFDDGLFRFDTSRIPEAVQLFRALDVKHEPLSLIPPQARRRLQTTADHRRPLQTTAHHCRPLPTADHCRPLQTPQSRCGHAMGRHAVGMP